MLCQAKGLKGKAYEVRTSRPGGIL